MRVAVIGAGVVGLCTAIELLEAGHQVTVFASRRAGSTTSGRAGAIWLPLLNSDQRLATPSYERRVAHWTCDSWRRLNDLLGHAAGLRQIRNHELFRGRERPPEYLRELLDDLSALDDDDLPAGFVFRWTFTTFVMEVPLYLPWLDRTVRKLGGRFVRRAFRAASEFGELGHPVVVNCTGLSARELAGDPTVRGIKGQLLLLDPLPLEDAFGAYDFGVLPRSDALVLGSLFQTEYDSTEPTEANTRAIWSEIVRWERVAPEKVGLPPDLLKAARIREVTAGIRPFRPQGVRLEVEVNDQMAVIHNYGHGGSGFTLSWGCALDVAAKVKTLV